jgi:hypothetical protein
VTGTDVNIILHDLEKHENFSFIQLLIVQYSFKTSAETFYCQYCFVARLSTFQRYYLSPSSWQQDPSSIFIILASGKGQILKL